MELLKTKSPKVTDQELIDAPMTKSKILLDTVARIKKVTQEKDVKIWAISDYTKQIKEEVEKILGVKELEKKEKEELDQLLAKNEDLITAKEKIIRTSPNDVVWIDKTFEEVKSIDENKWTPEEKTKYEVLKKEMELKAKEMEEVVKKATVIENKLVKVRYVLMHHAESVKSSAKVVASEYTALLTEYDTMNDLMGSIVNSLQSFISWVADIVSEIF